MLLKKSYQVDTFTLVEDTDNIKIFYLPTVAQVKNTSISIKVVDSMEDLDIKVGTASVLEESGENSRVGYMIRTKERVVNFGTGILIVKNSWYSVAKLSKPFTNEDIALRIKLDGLIAYNIPNKLAVFTTPYLSTKLHEYLTMI